MNRIIVLISLLASVLPAAAISFRVLPWDEETSERKLAIGSGKDSVVIGYMHPAARSAPVKVPDATEGLRLIANDRKNDDGTPASVPLVLGEGIKNPLLLILPDAKSKAGVRAMILEDDRQTFKWGTIRLLNSTSEQLVFRWDKDARSIPPGWKPVDVEPGGKSRNVMVYLYQKENLKDPLYSAVWEHRDDMRQLVFLVPNPDPAMGPVAFKFVSETRVEADEKPE
ncbi:MAG: hypothetical protein V4689_13200 [Verrucomicrobiota bacterium]